MNVLDMIANDIKQCVWVLYEHNICNCIVAYLLNHTHQSKLINAPRLALGILNHHLNQCLRYDCK